MWKLWKTQSDPRVSELVERVRALEASVKAQELEFDALHHYVRAQLGRHDRKKYLENKANEGHSLTREEIVRRASGL